MNPLVELQKYGQSFWYDNIRRGLLRSGEMKRLIDEDGLRGITSNPTIFEKAIADSTDYDEAIAELLRKNAGVGDILDTLICDDIRETADLFRPIHDKSEGRNGFVSIEVSPEFARDTDRTLSEARRLWKQVDRPNLMVKIPATAEGVPAIEQALYEGINVNVTLIFSLERYDQVIEAYLTALERRQKENKPVDQLASVASFFVSRIDTSVDAMLQDKLNNASHPAEKDAYLDLIGKVAVANAKAAYQLFKKRFGGDRFRALEAKGARVQRPLWASTGTKNPNYSDVLYVEELIGPDTVNTMPPATVSAFRDHGKPRRSVDDRVPAAEETLQKLREAGIDLKKVTAKLEEEGVKAFASSWEKLLAKLGEKREGLKQGKPNRQTESLGDLSSALEEALSRLEQERAVERLWAKDAGLWKSDAGVQAVIRNRLGWLTLVPAMIEHAAALQSFASDVKKAGFTHVVLLGMGGSSLCSEVCRQTFGSKRGWPSLIVLDTTDPEQVVRAEEKIKLDKTLFLVSSKSGGTIEVTSLYKYFDAKVRALKGDAAGEHFVAITDPGTSLEKLAHEKRFRKVFSAPADVGGRYSALTYFGLVPMALIGMDVKAFLERADRIVQASASCVPVRDNPSVRLGALMGAAAVRGRDKVTFFTSPEIESFGVWAEQLIAESTGKEGRGILPVEGEPFEPDANYGNDRLFVAMSVAGSPDDSAEKAAAALEKAGHPVVRIQLDDTLDLAQEFFRWEIATAVAGVVLGVNPFDEPNVKESKDNTAHVLDAFKASGKLPSEPALLEGGGAAVWADEASAPALKAAGGPAEALAAFFSGAQRGDYVSFLVYAAITPDNVKAVAKLRAAARKLSGAATTVGFGPRYLHSTGQLHKGGAANGLFVLITVDDAHDPDIPGAGFGFSTLKNAQALGDDRSLKTHGRRAVRLHLKDNLAKALQKLSASALKAPAAR